jgi:hypothetical protein
MRLVTSGFPLFPFENLQLRAPRRRYASALRDPNLLVTQQYIVGQLSTLLEELESACEEWLGAVRDLRQNVETSPLHMLPHLAREASSLTDRICLSALERGDVGDFRRHARTAVSLHELSASAGLWP